MILIEILLISVAWSRGWGARALIPPAVVFCFGYLLGFFLALNGVVSTGDEDVLLLVGLGLDLAMICVLALMGLHPPVPAASRDSQAVPASVERRAGREAGLRVARPQR